MKKGVFFILFVLMSYAYLGGVGAGISITGDVVSENGLGVSSVLLKITVTKGDSVEKSISLSSDAGDEINLEVISVEGVTLSEDSFVIDPGRTKDVVVFFDSGTLEPGVYVGSIIVTNFRDSVSLPVVFEVESEDVFFDANLGIAPQYTEVSPGEKVVASVKIFDLTGFQGVGSLGPTNIDIDYIIQGIDGSILSSETESIVVDGQTQFTKTLILPGSVTEGNYFFSIVVRYRSSVGTSSRLLSIKVSEEESSFKAFGDNFIVLLIFFAVLFLGIIFLFIYLIRDRDKFLLGLKRHNSLELKKQRELLLAQEKTLAKKKPIAKKEIKKEVKEKIKKLKSKQERRVREFRKLKKRGDTGKMERKLREWKRRGYNTLALESKLKGLGVNEMKDLMGKWKKQGYKTK